MDVTRFATKAEREPAGEFMNEYNTINDILVKLFHEIMDIEEKAIITEEFKDITNNDMHVIEAIGTEGARNMSTVAKVLSVTVGTLTIAMNSLVKKGYVDRRRSEEDRRVVLVSLSRKGKKAYEHHKNFHEEMVQGVLKDLDEDQVQVLVKALDNLAVFFRSYGKHQG